MRLEGWHLIIIIAIAVLLFGAPKLPGLARSVGQSLRIFKSEVKQMKEDGHDSEDGNRTPPTTAAHHSPINGPVTQYPDAPGASNDSATRAPSTPAHGIDDVDGVRVGSQSRPL